MHNRPLKNHYVFVNTFQQNQCLRLSYVLRVFRHVKIRIKKCFKSKWLFFKVKLINDFYE